MSGSSGSAPPLWLQGRDAVIAAADPADWRAQAPDYTLSHEGLRRDRTRSFAAGSLAAIVESLVQVFEMEVSHKKDPARWVSMVISQLRMRVNGGKWADAAAIAERGSYNLLIGDNAYYSAADETLESSNEVFHTAFPGGFLWEVLEVYSPPPVVSFKWRHFGRFEGPYKGFAATGQTIEMFGASVARCAEDLRIVEVEHFYDNSKFLSQLTGGCPIHRRATTPAVEVAAPGDGSKHRP